MKLKHIFTSIFVVLTITLASSLPPSGVGPGGGGGTDPDNEVPIDGGVGLLLIAGAAFGAKKVLKKK